MRLNKVSAVLAAGLGLVSQAYGSVTLDLNFNDGANTVAGQFTAVSMGGNQYLATSGTLTLSGSSNSGLVGSYSLVPVTAGQPAGPGYYLSPSGSFWYNNVIYSGANPCLDTYGLLGLSSDKKTEINLWATGPGTYCLWASTGTQNWVLQGGGSSGVPATTTISAVPESPTTFAGAGALGLALLGLGAQSKRSTVLRMGK